jgi:hypothetical protein
MKKRFNPEKQSHLDAQITAAKAILEDIERYDGEESLMVRCSRMLLEREAATSPEPVREAVPALAP